MIPKFSIKDLVRFTVYAAVIAWLASFHVSYLIPVWVGMVFGFEIGRRSEYSTLLLALVGMVMGLAFVFAYGSTYFEAPPQIAGFLRPLNWVTWAMFLAIFLWLCYRPLLTQQSQKNSGAQ